LLFLILSSVTGAADFVKQVGEWNTKNTIQQPKDLAFYDDNTYDIVTIPIPNPLKAVNGEDVYWREVEVTIPLHFEHGVTEPRLYFWIGCMDSAGGGTFWCDTNDDPASPFEIKPNEITGEALIEVPPEGENKITEPTVVGGRITNVVWPTEDTYNHTEPIPVDVNFMNMRSEAHSFWVGFSVQDSTGKWWDAPAQQTATIQPGESSTLQLQWQPPEAAPDGAYNTKVALWNGQKSITTGLMESEFDSRMKNNAFQLNPIQAFDVIQIEALGGWNRTLGRDLVPRTIDGGYIMTGMIRGDVSLFKTDASGSELWNKSFGGSEGDLGRAVQQTNDSGYIITGMTNSYGAGGGDIWLIKTDANGNKLWDKTFGGSANDEGLSVKQTNDSGYIITGMTNSYGAGGGDVWLIKTDANGNKLWNKTFGGSEYDFGNSVQQTSDGGYVITGGTNSYRSGHQDVWLIKIDANGNKLWDRTFSRPDIEWGNSVQQTRDGGYVITANALKNSYALGGYDVWLIKIDANGN
jgi:hypothetical protein